MPTPNFGVFDQYRQRKAEALFAKQRPEDYSQLDETDPALVESRQKTLDEYLAEMSARSTKVIPKHSPLLDVGDDSGQVAAVKKFRAQSAFNKIKQGNYDLTMEDFRAYDEYAGELRSELGSDMSIMNFISGAFDAFKEGFVNLGEGVAEVHKDGEYQKIVTSLIEGGARDQRELWGSIWHSRNKDSWAYGVKQFLTGADTFEERWANFQAAQQFAKNSERYLNGEDGLIFDPRYTNKNLVAAGEILGDPSFLLGFVSGGAGFLASAARSVGGVATSRALRGVAKAALVTSRASDYVTGLPLKAVGYPLWLAGAGAVKVTTGSINIVGKVAESLTGGAIQANTVAGALRTVGLGSAVFGTDPFSRKFAAFYGLGLVAEGVGGVAVGTAQALGRSGARSVMQQVAENTTIPTISRRIANISARVDNIVPIPSLTVDALRGGMMGMSFNALLGAYADGAEGAYNSAQAGFGYGAFGGVVGGTLSKVGNLSGRQVMLKEYDAVINDMGKTDPAQALNIRRYVDRHDKLGVETRHYVLGVANRLAGTAKVMYLDQNQYTQFVGQERAGTQGFFQRKVGNGVNLVAINIDQVFAPTGNKELDAARGESSSTTNVHEMFHAIMWNSGYKQGMINRLTHHLLGMEVNGQRIINTAVKPEEIRAMFSVYAKKLEGKTDITQSEWYNEVMSGLAEYEASGKIGEGLRNGIEEFGAMFFEEWIKGKPMDYLFRGGDLGFARNSLYSVKEAFGNAIRYGLKTMGHDLVEAGYNFTEVDARINRGGIGAARMREGFLNGTTLVRDPVMDRIMQDVVRNTWRPIANTTIDTLEGDELRIWAEMTGNQRRIYQDRRGVWKFKDVKQFRREEAERGQLLFKTLEEMRDAGVDIGAEIVDANGNKRIEGHLNAQAVAELIKRGVVTSTEGRNMIAIQQAVERGIDPKTKQPNGLRFEYHGLSEEVDLADGTTVRNRRPWQNVDISDRRVIPYRMEYVLTTRDTNGNKIEPEFVQMMTSIDLDALDRRINANYNTPIRMKNGKVTTVGKLLSGRAGPNWAAIRGKVKTYLTNLSKQNARPSALLFGGGVEGAAIRDALYMIFGSVPSATSQFVNRPNASLPANKRGTDFVFTTFRFDLMYNLEETGSRLTFNEELAYPRTQSNYKPSEEMLNNPAVVRESLKMYDKNRPAHTDRNGKPISSGKNAVKVRSEFSLQDGTKVTETSDGVYVRSPFAKEDIIFEAEKAYGEDGKPLKDIYGKDVYEDVWIAVNEYLNVQTEFSDALSRADIGKGYGVVEHNGKYIVAEQSPDGSQKYIVDSKVFENAEDAEAAAREIYKADRTHDRILNGNSKLPVVNSKGETIATTREHRVYASRRLRELLVRNITNPETSPLEIQMVNGLPVVEETFVVNKDGEKVPKYKLKVAQKPYEMMKNAGLKISDKIQDPEAYNLAVSKYSLALINDLKTQIGDGDVRGAINWYKEVRREIRFLYGPASDMFFELLGATSPNEGPEQNWKYAVEAMERYVKGEYDAPLEIAAKKRDQIMQMVESGQFRTMLEQNKALAAARSGLESVRVAKEKRGEAFTYTEQDVEAEAMRKLAVLKAAKEQAAEIIGRGKLKQGEVGKNKVAEITEMLESNTLDRDDKLSSLVESIMGTKGFSGMNLKKSDLIEAAHAELNKVATELGNSLLRPSTNEKRGGELVRYGMHNKGIAQVMLGMYERLNYGPKTYNYQLNLKGAGERATIDIWAARTMRRIIMTTNGNSKWRLLPIGESGVDDGSAYVSSRSNYDGKNIVTPEGRSIDSLVLYNDSVGDFFFAQDIFAEAANQIRSEFASDPELNSLEPHELQAVMWFREKKLWAKNRWTSGAGAALSSYETQTREMIGEEAPVDAEDLRAFRNVQRYTINASLSTPATSGNQTGKIGDLSSEVASKKTQLRVVQILGPALKTGVWSPAIGYYAGNLGAGESPFLSQESALGLDWTVRGDPQRLDNAFVEVVKLGIEIGMNGQQDTVIVSERVQARHPNARDTYTVFLDRQYDSEAPEVKELYIRMARISGQAGGTAEPTMQRINGRTRIIGFTFHHVPEFDVIYGGARIENQAALDNLRRGFKSGMESALSSFGWGVGGTNADGSTSYVRGKGTNIVESEGQQGDVKINRMIADVVHGYVNSVVVTHNEYASVDPVYLTRRNTNLLQNVQRVFNHNERAKQKRDIVREQGDYSRPRQPIPETAQASPEQVGADGQVGDARQEEGVYQTPTIQTDGRLSDSAKVDEYVEATKKVFDPKEIRSQTSLMTVGANSEFIISRGITEGKADDKVRVVHKNDSFPVQFETEAQALEYVRKRLAGEVGPPRNKEEAYDYYVRGVGIVSGVRRAAIDRLPNESTADYAQRVKEQEGGTYDHYGEKLGGAISGDSPLFMFFQQNDTSDAERGPFGSSVYVDPADTTGKRRLYRPFDGGPDMGRADFGKWREAVAAGRLDEAKAIVKSVLESKGFRTGDQDLLYHGKGKQDIGDPRNWRSFGLGAVLYLSKNQNMAENFASVDASYRSVAGGAFTPTVFELALHKDAQVFDNRNPEHLERLRAVLRDRGWIQKTLARIQAVNKNFGKVILRNSNFVHRDEGISSEYRHVASELIRKYTSRPQDAVESAYSTNELWSHPNFEQTLIAPALKDAGFDGWTEYEGGETIAIINPEMTKVVDGVTYENKDARDAKAPVDISQRGDLTRRNPAFKPAEDVAYEEALSKGDFATAQRMFDEKARARGYSDETYYHGTAGDDRLNVFTSRPAEGIAAYITPDRKMARRFASDQSEVLGGEQRHIIELRAKTDNIFDPSNKKHTDRLLAKLVRMGVEPAQARKDVEEVKNESFTAYEKSITQTRSPLVGLNHIQKAIQLLGYDGYFERETGLENKFLYSSDGSKVLASDEGVNPRNLAIHKSEHVKEDALVTYDDNGKMIPLSKRLDPNNPDIRYRPSDDVGPVRLSGKMVEMDVRPKIPNIDPKGTAFKKDFIGLYAEQNPDTVASLLLSFGKLSTPRYNYIGRGGTAKASKDTHVVELTSGVNKVGYLRFDIVPDRTKKGRKVMNNIVVDVDSAYRGNKFQHVLYSEAVERARILGATSFNQIIENEQGLPYRSQAKILGEGNSALADMYTLQSHPATEEGWNEAKYPKMQITIRKKDGTEEVKDMGRGENKYVMGYGNIDPNRRYRPADEANQGGETVPTPYQQMAIDYDALANKGWMKMTEQEKKQINDLLVLVGKPPNQIPRDWNGNLASYEELRKAYVPPQRVKANRGRFGRTYYKPSEESGIKVKTYSNPESKKPNGPTFIDGDIFERYL
jgi:hypothetical protein